MIRFCALLELAILVLLGCDRADFRKGCAPGEVETVDNATVYHLADGVFVVVRKVYYETSIDSRSVLHPQGPDWM